MSQENKEKNNNDFLSDELQQELEKLSWEFLLKEKEAKEKAVIENRVDDEKYYQPANSYSELDNLYGGSSADNRNFEFWHNSEEVGINNLNRDSGILFNEEKLEKHKVVAWRQAPRLREPGYKIFFKKLARTSILPFKLIISVSVGMTTAIGKSVIWVLNIVYKILNGALIILWQTLVAFKYIFVYIFGDFSWPKKEKLALESAAADNFYSKKTRKYLIKYPAMRMAASFAAVALLLVLPVQLYYFYNKAEKIKGEVLGASEIGMAHLLQAGIAGKNLDIANLGKEFNLASLEFEKARTNFKELGIVSVAASAVVPDVEAGEKLLTIAEKSTDIGLRLTGTIQAFGDLMVGAKEEGGGLELRGDLLQIQVTENRGKRKNWQEINKNLDMVVLEANEIQRQLDMLDLENTKLSAYGEQISLAKEQMPKMISLLQDYRDLTRIFLTIVGVDEPRRWLLVFQNNTEIRPTGGFMGSYAVVDVKDGKIEKIEVPGGGFYDLKGSMSRSVDAPYPFHLFSAVWQPWNANWFPDWPTSAEKIMWFYDKSSGPSVDGVISFTPDVLGSLLEITGPIELPEYMMTVDSNNFLYTIQKEVEFDYDKKENKPKKIIGDLLPKILERTLALDGKNGVIAAEKIISSLGNKSILLYFKNKDTQKIVDNFYWSGRVQDYDKDYLAIVHTNIAGGKTDLVVKNNIWHNTEITNDGQILNTVVLTREHLGKRDDIFESSTNTDFVRFYVPQGSKLITAEGFDGIPVGRQYQVATGSIDVDPHLAEIERNIRIDSESGTRIIDEFGKTSFGNWITVGPGEKQSVTIKYLLPWRLESKKVMNISTTDTSASWWQSLKKYFAGQEKQDEVPENIYGLLIQKQPGTAEDGFVGTLTVGDRWQIGDFLPKDGVASNRDFLEAGFKMDGDKYYGVIIKEK
ncbi:DUF4012 domain-containing protein [Candidatus Kuenenbacteria bacterium]|nr:DUF4012 domain-containing protein [Candidatus Kuenenbacteria bacterium]